MYIDAFAGTGRLELQHSNRVRRRALVKLPEPCRDGSPRRSLQVSPPFDRYLFIDRKESCCACLRALRKEFPFLSERIHVRNADANSSIKDLCTRTNWNQRRAVLFLDPFGLQVDWSTIEAVARTHAIDMWYWFPLGMGLNRLLPGDGKIGEAQSLRLDRVFGSHTWQRAFYRTRTRLNLFGEGESIEIVKRVGFKALSEYFTGRLKEVFPYVAQKPLWFFNSRGNPMYLLYFATADQDAEERLAAAQAIVSIPSTASGFSFRLQQLLSGGIAPSTLAV